MLTVPGHPLCSWEQEISDWRELQEGVCAGKLLRYYARDDRVSDQREVIPCCSKLPTGKTAQVAPRSLASAVVPVGSRWCVNSLASSLNESPSIFKSPSTRATAGSCRHFISLRWSRAIWPATRRDPSP